MAKIKLSDGREIPVVKPHLGDQMDLERQMRGRNKKYGPADFQEDMKLSGFQTAFALFASFNRAGIRTNIEEILELDLEQLGKTIEREPGDPTLDDDDEEEAEGEQTTDPQIAQTGAGDTGQESRVGLSANV